MTKCLCGEVLTATVNINRDVPSIVLSALFESLFSALFIGLIVWRLQKRYEESENKKEIYNKRIIDIEYEFYGHIQFAKNNFHKVMKILTNPLYDNFIENVNAAGKEIHSALDIAETMCSCSSVVLSKYSNYLSELLTTYNEFAGFLSNLYNSGNPISDEDQTAAAKHQTKIYAIFDDIDRIYYGLEPKKREKRTRNKNQKIMRKKGQHD